jgi:hypothetical protein
MCSILHIQKSKYQKLYKKAHEKSVFLLSLEKNLEFLLKLYLCLEGNSACLTWKWILTLGFELRVLCLSDLWGELLLELYLQPVLLWLFWRQSLAFCLDHDPSSHCSWDDRYTLLCTAFFCWDGVSRTFCSGYPQTISASQVASITGVSHQCPAWK